MLKKLLLVLILLVGCAATPKSLPTPTDFDYVCEQVENIGYSCDGIEAPLVVYTKLTRALRAYGVYVLGESYVFVDPEGDHVQITVYHEIAHYVLWFNGVKDRCRSEELARFIAGQTGEWRTLYGCTKGQRHGRSTGAGYPTGRR